MVPRWFAYCLSAVILSSAAAGASAAEGDWKAGIAAVVITPPEPVWLSGYSSRTEPAQGKIHDLYAKAACFEDGRGARLVLVTLDLGSVGSKITDAVALRAFERHKIPRAALILNVSHTHCAPEVAAERRVFHELADAEEARLVKYIAWLEDRIVDAIDGAVRDLAPARLSVSRSSAGFGFSRRIPLPGGGITAGQNPDGVVDRDVPVLRVTAPDGALRAVLFGYACHNTTLAFQQYCGDYAGFAQEALEREFPGAKALFVMGCGGDMNPFPRHGAMGLDHARAHGRALATAVKQALAGRQQEVAGPLGVAYEVVALDLEPLPPRARLEADAQQGTKTHAGRKARYLLDRLAREGELRLEEPCPLHAVAFGKDLLLIAISGETTVDYSLLCKHEFAGPFVWVAGYNDDVFAYLPSLRVLREGGYEGRDGIIHQLTPTPFAESVEDRVMSTLRRLVRQAGAAAGAR